MTCHHSAEVHKLDEHRAAQATGPHPYGSEADFLMLALLWPLPGPPFLDFGASLLNHLKSSPEVVMVLIQLRNKQTVAVHVPVQIEESIKATGVDDASSKQAR